MQTLIKADIFFFIASISTILLSLLTSILLYYLIKASKSLNEILSAFKTSYKETEEFASELKDRLFGNFIFRFFFPPVKKSPHKEKK